MIAADQNQSWLDAHASTHFANISWLNELRNNALAAFEQQGLPTVRDEEWRYTNLRSLKSHSYHLSMASPLSMELPATDNPRLVFVDGYLDAEHSSALELDGVNFVAGHLEQSDSSLAQYHSTTLPSSQHGFTALNTAYAQDGYVIELANNQVIENVIEVVFVSQNEGAVNHTRNFIIAGANTKCSVVERHIGKAGSVYLANNVTEIIAGDNAHIDHYKIQQESEEAFHIGGVFIQQQRSSLVKNHNIALSGLVTRNDIYTTLQGEGAHMEMNGLVFGTGRQHIDNHTQVDHAVPNCTSDEYYKTVLDDNSRSVFRGRIIVAQDAQQTNADQQNNNLLLSPNAEADTKPQLEIYADDVKCSHGATVGQLDEGSLFYLKSRGINNDSARALLTFAFANEVIDRVNIESIKDELTQLVAGELLSGLEELV